MKKLMAVVIASMFATAAYAQQAGSVPPEQPAAGTAGKLQKPNTLPANSAAATPSTTTDSTMAKPTTRAERKAARKAKRAAKVGDKPIN